MIISARERVDGQTARPGAEPAGSSGLNSDEWQFLRATPDYDAEEMSSAVASGPVGEPVARPPVSPSVVPEAARPPIGPLGEFPEASALAELLGDLVDARTGAEAPGADPMWAAVPAAEEWASLMEPQADGASAPSVDVPEPPLPAVHDALMDALAACERAGLMSRSEGEPR